MTAKSSIQNLKLGIFVVIGTILILIASYLIGNRQNMFTRNFTISAVFNNVNGLQVGNNVRFSGINIGTVDRLQMENDTTIYVFMKVEEKMQKFIKRNAIATIGSDGLVGSMLVNIVPGTGEAPMVEDGDQLESYSKIGTQDMLKTLNVTNENAALLTSDLLQVTQSLTQGKGTLGRLLNDTIMANDLSKTIKNLKYSSQKVNTTLDELQKAVQALETNDNIAGVLLSDSISASKLRHIIENLEISSEQINKVTEDLSSVVGNMKEGEGMLNLVAKDTAMANQLMRTMQNIEEGTAKFNENMEALKHNFLTRRYFKKLEKESN
ncbi:MlaD family protein [Flagellimonas beolgyonensis]|jgi:phospholipid/cholesterol/gamma-HCH transport system substrate-binding protein|uniref:MlaD family protein n=1 Tax=Flagellimonas beolgyonensis TaxID=864064 RepID=UPI000F8DFCD4|nr:MlaD family protein [Allomuricauda beolgyonensis]